MRERLEREHSSKSELGMEKLTQNLAETLDGVRDAPSKLMVLYECNRKLNYTSAVVRNWNSHTAFLRRISHSVLFQLNALTIGQA